MSGDKSVALLVGAGDAIGAAVGRRFAAGGYTVCFARQSGEKAAPHVDRIVSAGGRTHGLSVDARNEAAVAGLFDNFFGPGLSPMS